jgi:hypothetical protein
VPLQLKTSPPILIFGTVDGAAGEVWLENKSGASITVSKAVVAVTVGAVTDTGTITFADVPINNGAIKRVVFRFGLDVFTPPGTHPATVTLETSAGSLPVTAELIVAKKLDLELAETSTVFTGVTASTTYQGTVIAMNRGNIPVTVGEIPDEPLVEVVTTPRVLTVAPGGDVSVAPAPGLAPAGTATFTNTKPTVEPGDWAVVTFDLTTPAGLTADRYFRVLPRIATRRFVIDLVT